MGVYETVRNTRDIDTATPLEKWPEGAIKSEKRRIWKNILLISLGFLMLFTAFNGLSRLQSSLHRVDGMGTISQSVLYGSLVISCLFLPKLLIAVIGHKWTMSVSMACYVLWMAANGYAVWATMIPASILVGIGAAPLWTAQCSYFTKIGVRYAKLNDEIDQDVIARFFGIFFMSFQFSGIIGSVISSTILRPGEDDDTGGLDPELIAQYCGPRDCPWNNVSNPNLEPPPNSTVWTMVGVYMVIAIAAIVLVSVLVENIPRDLKDPKLTGKDLLQEVAATAKQLRNKAQLLLIPITMYSGFEQAFFSADFMASFVTCMVGIHFVGLVTIAYATTDTLMSVGTGYLKKYTGRVPIFLAGAVIDICIQITLQMWVFSENDEYVLFIIAALWGISDAIWQTQINAMYGAIFTSNSEAAFSNYRMWESLGFIIAFAYSSFLCTSVKLYVLTCVLIVGITGWAITEVVISREKTFSDSENMTAGTQMSSVGYNDDVTVVAAGSSFTSFGVENKAHSLK